MGRAGLLLASVLAAGCGDGTGPPVELVLPTGYTGTVSVFLDPDAPDIPLVDGRYRVVFPPDGVLRARSHRPFHQWHATTARYADGTPIPWVSISGAEVGPDVIAVRRWGGESTAGTDGRETQEISFCVGTADQCGSKRRPARPPARSTARD